MESESDGDLLWKTRHVADTTADRKLYRVISGIPTQDANSGTVKIVASQNENKAWDEYS